MKNTRFDVTTIGSTMIRFSVPAGERLETAAAYSVHTAGTEGNTMVALSRMGLRCGWISRLKNDALGKRIEREIHGFGVDTSRIIWTDKDRNEIFYVEYGENPRGIQVIYDRRGSALSRIQFKEVDTGYLFDTRILHMTGILPALSPHCRKTTENAIVAAKDAGVKISFDVNYRSKLWSAKKAAQVLRPLMEMSDILFITREDALDLFGLKDQPDQLLHSLYNQFHPEICIVTLGSDGGIAFDGSAIYQSPTYKVHIIDRLGAGDSFTAGFLCGYLEGSIVAALNYASAMAALKLGIRGDYFVSDRREVLQLIKAGSGREVKR
ncbi:MAG: sugar kinase [Deltaproteobacteria bacterium]|nr:sugar kinase [Deltaproteobacteria bacterium]MBW1995042.1 sugar kinase [Deltaproteobacteria bacterium]